MKTSSIAAEAAGGGLGAFRVITEECSTSNGGKSQVNHWCDNHSIGGRKEWRKLWSRRTLTQQGTNSEFMREGDIF